MTKVAVIDVGGGYRGIYNAGIFDYCLDNDINFDIGFGVSAGSANICAYAAKQPGRNYRYFSQYILRKEYASMHNFIHKKSYLDLDYIYSTLSNSDGEDPLDYQKLIDNPIKLYIVATNANTGNAKYFTKDDMQLDNYDILKASCCIPFVCQPYSINNTLYYDGALSDPVPIIKALEHNVDKIVLLLTLPIDTIRNAKKDTIIAKLIQRQYPLAAYNLRNRASNYNKAISYAKKLDNVLIVAPDDTCGVDTLTKDVEALNKLYNKGYKDGAKIKAFMEK